jgi:hypothetical protein
MKQLALLPNLADLNIGGTLVTDKGLKDLTPLRNLSSLGVFEARGVTVAGANELRRALPKCFVYGR